MEKIEMYFIKETGNSMICVTNNNKIFKWKFSNHVSIVNVNDLIIRINAFENIEINPLLRDFIAKKIELIRFFSFETIKAAKTYICEQPSYNFSGVFKTMLFGIKKNEITFIQELILFIFSEINSIKNNEINNEFNSEIFDLKVRLSFQKELIKIIKFITLKNPSDKTFSFLLEEHKRILTEQEENLLFLRKSKNNKRK